MISFYSIYSILSTIHLL